MTLATLKNRSHIFAEYRVFVWLILKPTLASSPWIFTDISCRHQRAWVQIPLSAKVIYSPICLLVVIEQNEVWFWWKFIRWNSISMKWHGRFSREISFKEIGLAHSRQFFSFREKFERKKTNHFSMFYDSQYWLPKVKNSNEPWIYILQAYTGADLRAPFSTCSW